MTYNEEVIKNIKDIREKIESCENPLEAIILQSDLLEILKNTLTDTKFKEGLLEKKAGNVDY